MNYKSIRNLCKEKHATILAHYYTRDDVQSVADFVGDSLALAQKAASTDADILVMCGVDFMAETCKILCPEKKVLVPCWNAGCSLADSCRAEDLQAFLRSHPDYKVVSYVNTTAEVKALSYICVTSSNAKKVIDSFPTDEKLLFCPDRNLGSYINRVTGRQMLLWDGGCHVHSGFSASTLSSLKDKWPGVKVLAHPECKEDILSQADVIGSTAAILKYAHESSDDMFIVATEPGIFFSLKQQNPGKRFISAAYPSENGCEGMKLSTLEGIARCLETGEHEVHIDPAIAQKAITPIRRMLEIK